MKKIYRILFGIHIFVGVGALAGGLFAILNPNNPVGMTVDNLKNSPFTSFLIPGIFLFTVIGLGNLFSAITIYVGSKYQAYVSGVVSLALVFWIIIQCIILQAVVPLHIIYFIIGCIQSILSALILVNQQLFPVNLILKLVTKCHTKYPENILFQTLLKWKEKIVNL